LYGDAVQEKIVPMLTPRELPKDKDVLFRYGEKQINHENVFYHPEIPYGTELVIKYGEIAEYENLNSIFFIECWTYGKDDSIEKAEDFKRKFPFCEIRFILLESDRKVLSTDISSIQSAMKSAEDFYKNKGFRVMVFPLKDRAYDIMKLFFLLPCDYNAMLRDDLMIILKNAKDSFEIFYDFYFNTGYFKIKDRILDPLTLESFTRFERDKGITKLSNIAMISSTYFFGETSEFRGFLLSLIKFFLKDVYIYDAEALTDNLLACIDGQYELEISKLPSIPQNLFNEKEYRNYLLKSKFDETFVVKCNNFFEKSVESIIKTFIMDKLDHKILFKREVS
jgi:hypothetical protein